MWQMINNAQPKLPRSEELLIVFNQLRFPFLELMDLPNLISLMKSYQYIPLSDWMGGKFH